MREALEVEQAQRARELPRVVLAVSYHLIISSGGVANERGKENTQIKGRLVASIEQRA